MSDFLRDAAHNPFLYSGLLAGLLASLACGVIGPHLIARRLVFLAGAIAHIAVGGLGAAIFLAHKFETFAALEPMHGALASALLAAVILALVERYGAERLDTLIGALWATGMAVGILLIKFTPGYHSELMGYLFGNIVYADAADVRRMAVLGLLVALGAALFHKRFLALCVDPQQAELQGVSVFATHLVFLLLVALTVISLTQVVGLILVIALLSLPAATAAHLARRLPAQIGLATLLCALLTTVPRIAVYGTRVSPESAIVLASGALYLLTALLRKAWDGKA